MRLLCTLLLVLVWQGCEVGETDTAEVRYPDELEDAGKVFIDADAVGTKEAGLP
jgi:hypothetical protein